VTAGWNIVEYRGRRGLEQLETDWRRLYAAMPLRTTFHAYDAHLAYVDHLMVAPEQLRCLVLDDGCQVRAICPLESRTDRALGAPIGVWGTPWHPHWPLSDIICPEDDARRAFIPTAADHLRCDPEGRSLLVLGPVPENSVIWEGLRDLDTHGHCAHREREPFVFDCERTFEELTSRLSKHFRKELKRCGKRLASLADVSYQTVTDGADYGPLFEAFLEVEGSGWKGEAGTRSAIRLHPEYVAFYRRLAANLGAGDACEINALFAEGRCIAGEFCMRTGEEYAALKIGYDERYARLSPGHLLGARTLERSCSNPQIKRFNQLSDAEWLRVWRADTIATRQAHVAIGGLSGRPLVAALRFRYGPGRRVARRLRHRG
jgi:hypothetical protein